MKEKEYTKEELDKYKFIERCMWLRDIEIGKPLTEKQYTAIHHFLGEIIDMAKGVKMTSVNIHFDKLGQAHSIDNNGIVESVNGKKL